MRKALCDFVVVLAALRSSGRRTRIDTGRSRIKIHCSKTEINQHRAYESTRSKGLTKE